MVNIIQKYMTKNDCYKTGRKITVKGLMVHSTATPGVMADGWFSRWNKPGIAKCVHAFTDDKGAFQYLPWNHRGWHGGGSSNNTHIGVEMCEPKNLNDKVYFEAVWKNTVELFAFLCKEFNLTEKDIIGHYEGYRLGVASNHADPGHWFPKHGKSMNDFRNDVAKLLKGGSTVAVYRYGDKGTGVKLLQTNLKTLGYSIAVDGSFGPGTKTVVEKFQKANGLTVDGIAGPQTQVKIVELVKKLEKPKKEVVEFTLGGKKYRLTEV